MAFVGPREPAEIDILDPTLALLGRILIAVALVTLAAGLVLLLLSRLPLDQIPGNIRIERSGFRLHIPVGTMILLSVLLTLGVNLILYFLRRSG